MLSCAGSAWSIPAENLGPLLEALASDFFDWKGLPWDGYSESLREYFLDCGIDPTVTYRRFLFRNATQLPCHILGVALACMQLQQRLMNHPTDKRYWIDVLIVNQNAISTSDQVIQTTDSIYSGSKIEVFLDNSYLSRAWCLAEAGQYTNPKNKCTISVSGSAELKPGTDFFNSMDAGRKSDIPLIQTYILVKYGSAERFNTEIDKAVLRLSPWSLMHQGRYGEVLNACEKEIEILEQDVSARDTVSMANAYGCIGVAHFHLGNYHESIKFSQKALAIQIMCLGNCHPDVATTQMRIGVVLQSKGDFENALIHLQEALEIYLKCLGPHHGNADPVLRHRTCECC
jgi:hypothetical protein